MLSAHRSSLNNVVHKAVLVRLPLDRAKVVSWYAIMFRMKKEDSSGVTD